MGRRSAAEAVLHSSSMWERHRTLHLVFSIFMATACAIAAAMVFGQVERFLITDDRFVLPGPPEPGIPSEHFRIEGAVHASERQITRTFLQDFGRSVYLCPIRERRRQLLAIDWVKDASVSRIWPDQLVIRLTERKPVAFIQVPGRAGAMTYSLVDAEGVLLNPPRTVRFHLPVLSGVPSADTEERRKVRVQRFLRLQSELGPLMERISEIDVSDIDNIKVITVLDGRALTLMLGNQNFERRLRNVLDNYSEIRKRLPDATILDLRLKDRITAVGGSTK
jgi:cell division protein FtsQ